uniref:Uncharacterized protein n=1 Tax=Daphnia magna TaxID=35525 RepID=A0A0P5Z178_9CRUS
MLINKPHSMQFDVKGKRIDKAQQDSLFSPSCFMRPLKRILCIDKFPFAGCFLRLSFFVFFVCFVYFGYLRL